MLKALILRVLCQSHSDTTVKNENEENEDTNMKAVSVNFADYDEQENELYYDKQLYENDSNEVFVEFVEMKTTCKNCHEIFKLNNKLHKHFNKKQCIKKSSQKISVNFKIVTIDKTSSDLNTKISKSKIIQSSTSIDDLKFDVEFKN